MDARRRNGHDQPAVLGQHAPRRRRRRERWRRHHGRCGWRGVVHGGNAGRVAGGEGRTGDPADERPGAIEAFGKIWVLAQRRGWAAQVDAVVKGDEAEPAGAVVRDEHLKNLHNVGIVVVADGDERLVGGGLAIDGGNVLQRLQGRVCRVDGDFVEAHPPKGHGEAEGRQKLRLTRQNPAKRRAEHAQAHAEAVLDPRIVADELAQELGVGEQGDVRVRVGVGAQAVPAGHERLGAEAAVGQVRVEPREKKRADRAQRLEHVRNVGRPGRVERRAVVLRDHHHVGRVGTAPVVAARRELEVLHDQQRLHARHVLGPRGRRGRRHPQEDAVKAGWGVRAAAQLRREVERERRRAVGRHRRAGRGQHRHQPGERRVRAQVDADEVQRRACGRRCVQEQRRRQRRRRRRVRGAQVNVDQRHRRRGGARRRHRSSSSRQHRQHAVPPPPPPHSPRARLGSKGTGRAEEVSPFTRFRGNRAESHVFTARARAPKQHTIKQRN